MIGTILFTSRFWILLVCVTCSSLVLHADFSLRLPVSPEAPLDLNGPLPPFVNKLGAGLDAVPLPRVPETF